MRQRFAPSHDLCGRMRYVHEDDSAWRLDLINAECTEIVAKARAALPTGATDVAKAEAAHAHKHPDTGHPYWRYLMAQTRFDLMLPELQPYIDHEKQPETWSFRRLSIAERDEIGYLVGRGRTPEGFRFSFLKGVTKLENASGEAGQVLAAAIAKTPRDEAALLIAAENYAADCVADVGGACWHGSQDLTPLEKKA